MYYNLIFSGTVGLGFILINMQFKLKNYVRASSILFFALFSVSELGFPSA
jgi:hypothetical protein